MVIDHAIVCNAVLQPTGSSSDPCFPRCWLRYSKLNVVWLNLSSEPMLASVLQPRVCSIVFQELNLVSSKVLLGLLGMNS